MITGTLTIDTAADELPDRLDVVVERVLVCRPGELLQAERTALLIESVGTLSAPEGRKGPTVRVYLKPLEE